MTLNPAGARDVWPNVENGVEVYVTSPGVGKSAVIHTLVTSVRSLLELLGFSYYRFHCEQGRNVVKYSQRLHASGFFNT